MATEGASGAAAGSISNTVVAGTLGAPWVFTAFLLGNMFLLGVCVTMLADTKQEQHRTGTELRLIQQQLQDTNAILLRRGVLKPGDLENPTRGSSE